jgi:hypothetical protein
LNQFLFFRITPPPLNLGLRHAHHLLRHPVRFLFVLIPLLINSEFSLEDAADSPVTDHLVELLQREAEWLGGRLRLTRRRSIQPSLVLRCFCLGYSSLSHFSRL